MKKNVIALLLSVVLAAGSIGTVPVLAAETAVQEEIPGESTEVSVEAAATESEEDAGEDQLIEAVSEAETVQSAEEEPEQEPEESLDEDTDEQNDAANTAMTDETAAVEEGADENDPEYLEDSAAEEQEVEENLTTSAGFTGVITVQTKEQSVQPGDDNETGTDELFAGYVDSAFVRHVKWVQPLDKEERENIIKWWNVNVEGAEGEKDKYFFYNPEYYKKRFKNAETYIKTQELPCYHAVVTPDGVWHEPSKMGWFACTDGNPFDELEWDLHFKERFIDTAEFDWVATIVDCHI